MKLIMTFKLDIMEHVQKSTRIGRTSSGDVAHLAAESGLLNGGNGVTSSDDGDASLGGQASEGVGNALRGEKGID